MNEAKGPNSLVTRSNDAQKCLNFLLRRTSRIVGRHYDDALRPVGLRITQYSVMAALAHMGPTSLTVLAKFMAMEPSGLARNLKPLGRQGFLSVAPGKDRRTRVVKLTPAGQKKFKQAIPLWEKAQASMKNSIGQAEAARVVKLAGKISKRFE